MDLSPTLSHLLSGRDIAACAALALTAGATFLTALDVLPSQSPLFGVVQLAAALLMGAALAPVMGVAATLLAAAHGLAALLAVWRHRSARRRRGAYGRSLRSPMGGLAKPGGDEVLPLDSSIHTFAPVKSALKRD